MKNTIKKLVSAILAVAMLGAMSTSVFAADTTVTEVPTITQREKITSRIFDRKYDATINKSTFTELMYDSNDQDDTKVTLYFESSDAPGAVTFRLTEIRDDGTTKEVSRTLSPNGFMTVFVGAGNQFRIAAKGIDGNIYTRVVLKNK